MRERGGVMICEQHGEITVELNGNVGSPDNLCYQCEIDRLTAQLDASQALLAEANERCRLLDEKAGDWQHRYAQETMRLQSQLAERDAEINKLCELVALHTCHTEQLEQENAELSKEVEEYKKLCDTWEVDAQQSINLIAEARKQAAQEILQLLDNADWACSTYEETYYQAVCAIKSKFGLEG